MAGGIYVALSGALAQSQLLDATAMDLANASTQGYQRVRPVFREVLARTVAGGGPPLRFAQMVATPLDTEMGSIRTTGRPLDVVLPAGHYLEVSTPAGPRYTRAGSLAVSPQGVLTSTNQSPVLTETGTPMRADPNQPITIADDGSVTQNGVALGRLKIVRFTRPEALSHEGASLLADTSNRADPQLPNAPLTVGALEDSNVSLVGSMTSLVTATRHFEAFQRVIDSFREADHRAVSVIPPK